MKRHLATALLIFISTSSFAQKTKLNGIETMLNNYLRYKEEGDLNTVKNAVDEMIVHDETKALPKTWTYYGLVYQSILADEKYASKYPDAADNAAKGFKTASELDVKKNFKDRIETGLRASNIASNNKAIKLYGEKNYADAARYFRQSLEIREVQNKYTGKSVIDTQTLYSAGLSSYYAKQNEEAIKQFARLDELNANMPAIYSFLYELNLPLDKPKAIAYLDKGLRRFPSNNDLMITQINMAINEGKLSEMKSKLEDLLAKDPQNESIKKVMAQVHYNEGADIYNKAMEKTKQMNDTNDNNLYEKLKKERDEMLNTSIPVFEKALQYSPKDASTLTALKEIFAKLGNFEKSNEYKKMLQ